MAWKILFMKVDVESKILKFEFQGDEFKSELVEEVVDREFFKDLTKRPYFHFSLQFTTNFIDFDINY